MAGTEGNSKQQCMVEQIGLALVSLALLISLTLNAVFYIRRRAFSLKDTDVCCYPHIHDGERLSQNEEHYVHELNHPEQQENSHNHHEQQENPIYGNINTVRSDVCYESMSMARTRDRMKSLEPDLNYASLDLKVANKHKKKHRHQQGHTQGRNKLQDRLSVCLTTPMNAFFEVEADVDADLPFKDTCTMVSHSSIYLNSHQIAQETEEIERERGMHMERESVNQEDGGSKEWKGEQESEGRKDGQHSNGSICTQLSEVESTQSGTDHFNSSLSHDND